MAVRFPFPVTLLWHRRSTHETGPTLATLTLPFLFLKLVLHLLEPWNVLVLATIVLDVSRSCEKNFLSRPSSLLPLSILSSFTRIQREDFQSFHSFFPPFILLPSTGRASTGIPNWLETFLNRGTGPVSFSSPAVDPHDPEYPPPPPL